MFETVKVYNYKDMPKEIQRALKTLFYYCNYTDVLHPIKIGKDPDLFIFADLEAKREKRDKRKFPKGYEGRKLCRYNLLLENWLRENGALYGETVYINLSYLDVNKIYKSKLNKKWPKELFKS